MYDVVIIGGGPGGYASALYAHNFGLSVALIEKESVGGTCLIRGCIPAKSWLQAAEVFTTVSHAGDFGVIVDPPTFDWVKALERKNSIVNGLVSGLSSLLKHRKVDVIDGFGRLDGPGKVVVTTEDGEHVVEGHHVIVATGSVPRSIPNYDFDGTHIVSSDHALDWTERPDRVGIIGAGAIGCEFASLLTDLGADVHVFELMDQVVPGADKAAAGQLQKLLKRRGVKFHLGVSVGEPEIADREVVVFLGDNRIEVDVMLVAVGRAPLTENIGLSTTKVEVERGYLCVDASTQETAEPGVYAVGDIVAGVPQLAHAGFAEAIAAITHIATGETAPVNYQAIPLVVYTHPEMAEVGMTEAKAIELGIEVETQDNSFLGVGRAQIIGQNQGLVKVVAKKNGPIIGASIVGPQAGEMIHELMYAVGWEILPAEAAAFIHAHPTLSEAVGETLLASSGRGLH